VGADLDSVPLEHAELPPRQEAASPFEIRDVITYAVAGIRSRASTGAA
jgi:hypothetical protein